MEELVKVTYDNDRPVVSARELHDFLEVKTAYKDWFPRMCSYGFFEGVDFNPLKIERVQIEGKRTVNREIDDAALTIDMAKEICMLQRNEKGSVARKYFIEIEKEWNSPMKVMARAIDIAHKELATLKTLNLELTIQNKAMLPKAQYFDALCDRNTLLSIRDTVKELHIPERRFTAWLVENGYCFRNRHGALRPYANTNNGYFEMKEFVHTKPDGSQYTGTQMLVTPRGREVFRLLCEHLVRDEKK